MSKQYDPTLVGQVGDVLGGVYTSAGLALLYSNISGHWTLLLLRRVRWRLVMGFRLLTYAVLL